MLGRYHCTNTVIISIRRKGSRLTFGGCSLSWINSTVLACDENDDEEHVGDTVAHFMAREAGPHNLFKDTPSRPYISHQGYLFKDLLLPPHSITLGTKSFTQGSHRTLKIQMTASGSVGVSWKGRLAHPNVHFGKHTNLQSQP